MRYSPTELPGVLLLEIEPHVDHRGFFARTVCVEELSARGIAFAPKQMSISHNERRGTLRGMHFQAAPHEEAKIVRCTAGAIYDVIIDLRRSSPTFKKWIAVDLSAANRRALYIPRGLAHGFQTLADATEVLYIMDELHAPAAACGVRFDDPAFRISWPTDGPIMSERDASYRDFEP